MKFKYKFLLLLISISLIGCLYVSQSYAYWMVTKEQGSLNQITSGCFSISFTENNNSSINLGNTYPVNDTLGLNQTPYEFTIKNTCTISASYKVILSSLKAATGTTAIDDSKIKYAIYKKSGTGSENKPNQGKSLSSTQTNSETSSLKEPSNIKSSYQVDTGTLSGGTRNTDGNVTNGASVTYDLYLWIDESATTTDAAGKTFKANIDVISSATIN